MVTYRIVVDHCQCYRCLAGMAFAFVVNVVSMVVDSSLAAFAFAAVAGDASSFGFSTIANETTHMFSIASWR